MKKIFEIPELEIILFINDDIITGSGPEDEWGDGDKFDDDDGDE